MGWAENRIQDYQRGEPATWLERRMLEHANPVHFPLAMAASLGIAYGLWTHRRGWIVGSSVLGLAGHLYCWTRGDRRDWQALETPGGEPAALRAGRISMPSHGEGMETR